MAVVSAEVLTSSLGHALGCSSHQAAWMFLLLMRVACGEGNREGLLLAPLARELWLNPSGVWFCTDD